MSKLPWEGGLRQSTTQHGLPYPCKRHNQVSAIYCLGCQPDQCFSFWSYLQIKENVFFCDQPNQKKMYFQVYQWCHRPVQELPKPLQCVFLQMSSQPSNTWSLPILRHGIWNSLLWKYVKTTLKAAHLDLTRKFIKQARARTDINGNGSQRDSI